MKIRKFSFYFITWNHILKLFMSNDMLRKWLALSCNWVMNDLENGFSGYLSQVKVKVMLQLMVSMSWCQVHSGTCDQILFSVWKLMCCLCGAFSLTRGRVCLLSVTVISVQPIVKDLIQFTLYIYRSNWMSKSNILCERMFVAGYKAALYEYITIFRVLKDNL
jgi:hypothetical protein